MYKEVKEMVKLLQGDAGKYQFKEPVRVDFPFFNKSIFVKDLSVNPVGGLWIEYDNDLSIKIFESDEMPLYNLHAALLPIFTQTIKTRYEDLKAYLSHPDTKEELKNGCSVDIFGGGVWVCAITKARLTEDDEISVMQNHGRNSIIITQADTSIINTLWTKWCKLNPERCKATEAA